MSRKNTLPTLNILEPNKTIVFYTPIEGNDVLVRTGTFSDSNSFIHALLHAYSKEYVSMNDVGRIKFVKKLRTSIATKIDIPIWESMSSGIVASIPFKENITSILTDFYRYINRGNGEGRTKQVRNVIRECQSNNKDMSSYKLLSEVVTLDMFTTSIIPSAYEKSSTKLVSDLTKSLVAYSSRFCSKEFDKMNKDAKGKGLGGDKVTFYLKTLETLIESIAKESSTSAYDDYIKSLCDTDLDVNSLNVDLISEKFNRDIYFIDSKTRLPYKISNTSGSIKNIKSRKSLIVMWTGGSHYEIVGRLLSGNRIQREFDANDVLIKTIYTYSYKPERIPDYYPDLVAFLPKEVRKRLRIDVSDSEEERSRSRSRSKSRSHEKEEYVDSDNEDDGYEKSDTEIGDDIDRVIKSKFTQ